MFSFKAGNLLSLHTCQCVMHISTDICMFALEWVKCDSKVRNICMTGRKKMSSDVCQNEQKWFGRLPISGFYI